MATTTRVEQFLESGARSRTVSWTTTPTPIVRPSRLSRPRRAHTRRADRAASMRMLRSALAFYAAFYAIPVGMAVAMWFEP